MAFRFTKLEIPEVIHVESDIYVDDRGYFTETYKYPEFQNNGIKKPFVQVNHSKSTKGVLRGLHYQKDPMAQGKLVTVVEGEIFDVAVDIRVGSSTYGRWVAEILDAQRKNMVYVPEGFAHGFCALSDTVQVIYYCSEVYSSEHERGILWSDPELNIPWPAKDPIVSERDSQLPLLSQASDSFYYKKSQKKNLKS